MTDAEKLSALDTAALYQSQYDAMLRARDDHKQQAATLDSQMTVKKAQLDELWATLRDQVDSGL